jgi:hypothetical protein
MNSLRSSHEKDSEFSSAAQGSFDYKAKFRSKTEPRAPAFYSDDVVDRRQCSLRHQKHADILKEELERKKILENKEKLRRCAINAAIDAGVYKPVSRLHHHKKLVDKYFVQNNIRVDSVGVVDKNWNLGDYLYEQDYKIKHSKIDTGRFDGDSYDDDTQLQFNF